MRQFLFLILSAIMPFGILSADESNGFRLQKDVAQYKGSDYANVVHVARNISLEEAFEIAENNPNIDYFVYTKGRQMVLEIPSDVQFDRSQDPFGLVCKTNYVYDSGEFGKGYCRIFRQGDAVFFKKEGMWLGSAPGLADVYFKEQ